MIRRPCADAANEFIRPITQINSYLAFSFFHFSIATLLQLGVSGNFAKSWLWSLREAAHEAVYSSAIKSL